MQSQIYLSNKRMFSECEPVFRPKYSRWKSEFPHLCFLGTLVSYRLDGGLFITMRTLIEHPVLLIDDGEELTRWLLWLQG